MTTITSASAFMDYCKSHYSTSSNLTTITFSNVTVSKTSASEDSWVTESSLPNYSSSMRYKFVFDNCLLGSGLNYMFYKCTSIKEVYINANCTFYNNITFDSMCYDCTNLSTLEILPNISISGYVYFGSMCDGCTSLTSVTLPNSINASAFVYFSYTFYGCSSLSSLTIQNVTASNNITFYRIHTGTNLNLTLSNLNTRTKLEFYNAFKESSTLSVTLSNINCNELLFDSKPAFEANTVNTNIDFSTLNFSTCESKNGGSLTSIVNYPEKLIFKSSDLVIDYANKLAKVKTKISGKYLQTYNFGVAHVNGSNTELYMNIFSINDANTFASALNSSYSQSGNTYTIDINKCFIDCSDGWSVDESLFVGYSTTARYDITFNNCIFSSGLKNLFKNTSHISNVTFASTCSFTESANTFEYAFYNSTELRTAQFDYTPVVTKSRDIDSTYLITRRDGITRIPITNTAELNEYVNNSEHYQFVNNYSNEHITLSGSYCVIKLMSCEVNSDENSPVRVNVSNLPQPSSGTCEYIFEFSDCKFIHGVNQMFYEVEQIKLVQFKSDCVFEDYEKSLYKACTNSSINYFYIDCQIKTSNLNRTFDGSNLLTLDLSNVTLALLNNVTIIDLTSAFANIQNNLSITLPDINVITGTITLTTAFAYSKMKTINLPKMYATRINFYSTFADCSELISCIFDETNANVITFNEDFKNCTSLITLTIQKLTSTSECSIEYLTEGCTSLENLRLIDSTFNKLTLTKLVSNKSNHELLDNDMNFTLSNITATTIECTNLIETKSIKSIQINDISFTTLKVNDVMFNTLNFKNQVNLTAIDFRKVVKGNNGLLFNELAKAENGFVLAQTSIDSSQLHTVNILTSTNDVYLQTIHTDNINYDGANVIFKFTTVLYTMDKLIEYASDHSVVEGDLCTLMFDRITIWTYDASKSGDERYLRFVETNLPNYTPEMNYKFVFNNCNLSHGLPYTFKDTNQINQLEITNCIISEQGDFSNSFENSKFRSIDLSGIVSIDNNEMSFISTFKNCDELESVVTPNIVDDTGIKFYSTFENCHNLSSITFGSVNNPTNSTIYFQNTIKLCPSLNNVTIQNINTKNIKFTNLFKIADDDTQSKSLTLKNITTPDMTINKLVSSKHNVNLVFENINITSSDTLTIDGTVVDVINISSTIDFTSFDFSKAEGGPLIPEGLDAVKLIFKTSDLIIESDNVAHVRSKTAGVYIQSFTYSLITTVDDKSVIHVYLNRANINYTSVCEGCVALNNVKFGNSLSATTDILMNNAFKDCSSLTKIEFPNVLNASVNMTGTCENCTALANVTFKPMNSYGSTINMTNTFRNNSSIKELNFHDITSGTLTFTNTFTDPTIDAGNYKKVSFNNINTSYLNMNNVINTRYIDTLTFNNINFDRLNARNTLFNINKLVNGTIDFSAIDFNNSLKENNSAILVSQSMGYPNGLTFKNDNINLDKTNQIAYLKTSVYGTYLQTFNYDETTLDGNNIIIYKRIFINSLLDFNDYSAENYDVDGNVCMITFVNVVINSEMGNDGSTTPFYSIDESLLPLGNDSNVTYKFVFENCTFPYGLPRLFMQSTRTTSVELVNCTINSNTYSLQETFANSKVEYIDMSTVELNFTDATEMTMCRNADALTTLKLPNSIVSTAAIDMSNLCYNCINLTTLVLPEVISSTDEIIMYRMLFNCSSLDNFDLTTEITAKSISMEQMLYNCSSIRHIIIEKPFTLTGNLNLQYAFSSIQTLETVTFKKPISAASITFTKICASDPNLTTFTLTNEITSEGLITFDRAFENCSALTTLKLNTINSGNLSFVSMLSNCTGLISFIFTKQIIASGYINYQNMCAGCASLEQVKFNQMNAASIDFSGLLSGCTSMKSLTFDKSITATTAGINFATMCIDCVNIESIIFNEPINANGNVDLSNLAYNKQHISTLTIPEITTVGSINMNNLCHGCRGLTSISLPNSITATTDITLSNAFANSALTSLTLPSITTGYGYSVIANNLCSASTSLTSLTVNNITAGNLNGFNLCANCNQLTSVSFPNSMGLTGVTNLTTAFSDCSAIQTLALPTFTSTVNFSHTFDNCINLEILTLPSLITQANGFVNYDHSFTNCDKIKKYNFENITTKELTMNDLINMSVTSFDDGTELTIKNINAETIIFTAPVQTNYLSKLNIENIETNLINVSGVMFDIVNVNTELDLSAIPFRKVVKNGSASVIPENNASFPLGLTFDERDIELDEEYRTLKVKTSTSDYLQTFYYHVIDQHDGKVSIFKSTEINNLDEFIDYINDEHYEIQGNVCFIKFEQVTINSRYDQNQPIVVDQTRLPNYSANMQYKFTFSHVLFPYGMSQMFMNTTQVVHVTLDEYCVFNAGSYTFHQTFTNSIGLEVCDLECQIKTNQFYQTFQKTKIVSIDLSKVIVRVNEDVVMEETFDLCTQLEQAKLPLVISTTGSVNIRSVFNHCTSLSSITFPAKISGTEVIISNFCNECDSLTDIVFTPTVISTGNTSFTTAFANCSNINSIVFPTTLTVGGSLDMNSVCADMTNITSISLPSELTVNVSLNLSNFCRGCTSLEHLELNSELNCSGTINFTRLCYGCSNLIDLTFPESITCNSILFDAACSNCAKMITLDLPNSIKATTSASLLELCNGCSKLEVINMPTSIITKETSGGLVNLNSLCPNCPYVNTINIENIKTYELRLNACLIDKLTSNEKIVTFKNVNAMNVTTNGIITAETLKSFECSGVKFDKVNIELTFIDVNKIVDSIDFSSMNFTRWVKGNNAQLVKQGVELPYKFIFKRSDVEVNSQERTVSVRSSKSNQYLQVFNYKGIQEKNDLIHVKFRSMVITNTDELMNYCNEPLNYTLNNNICEILLDFVTVTSDILNPIMVDETRLPYADNSDVIYSFVFRDAVITNGIPCLFKNTTRVNDVNIESGCTFEAYDDGLYETFNNATGLTNVRLQCNIPTDHLYKTFTNTKIESVNLTKITPINSYELIYTFSECQQLKTVTFPTSINISDNITMNNTFNQCNRLSILSLPKTIKSTSGSLLISNLVKDSSSLNNLILPTTINVANEVSFINIVNNCSSFTSLTSPTTIQSNSINYESLISNCQTIERLEISTIYNNVNDLTINTLVNNSPLINTISLPTFNIANSVSITKINQDCVLNNIISIRNITTNSLTLTSLVLAPTKNVVLQNINATNIIVNNLIDNISIDKLEMSNINSTSLTFAPLFKCNSVGEITMEKINYDNLTVKEMMLDARLPIKLDLTALKFNKSTAGNNASLLSMDSDKVPDQLVFNNDDIVIDSANGIVNVKTSGVNYLQGITPYIKTSIAKNSTTVYIRSEIRNTTDLFEYINDPKNHSELVDGEYTITISNCTFTSKNPITFHPYEDRLPYGSNAKYTIIFDACTFKYGIPEMFQDCGCVKRVIINDNCIFEDYEDVLYRAFNRAYGLEEVVINCPIYSPNMEYTFQGTNITNIDLSNVYGIENMFGALFGCTELESIIFPHIDKTSEDLNLQAIDKEDSALKYIDLSNVDTSKVPVDRLSLITSLPDVSESNPIQIVINPNNVRVDEESNVNIIMKDGEELSIGKASYSEVLPDGNVIYFITENIDINEPEIPEIYTETGVNERNIRRKNYLLRNMLICGNKIRRLMNEMKSISNKETLIIIVHKIRCLQKYIDITHGIYTGM